MPRRDPRAYLLDIHEAAALLDLAVQGRTREQYGGDPILRSAVERQLITIGEALVQFLRATPEAQGRISNTRQIIALRNILVHGYADVSNDIVWSTLHQDLPVLRLEAAALLDELGAMDG
ncbi:MAG: HepT-like ribonuclease domain-containing protein [Chloroflexota bacterium]